MLGKVLSAIFAVVVAFFAKLAYDAGEFKTLVPHGAENCVATRGGIGLEDVAATNGQVYASSDVRAWMDMGKGGGLSMRDRIRGQKEQGGLYRLADASGKSPYLAPVSIQGFKGEDFHPHGMASSGISSTDGKLWVVNHARNGDHVELFHMTADDEATHVCSFSHEFFRNLNDLSLTSKAGEIYVTNWQYYEPGTTMSTVEMFGQRPWGYLLHCNVDENSCSADCKIVADNIKMPNSVAVSSDDKEVYLTASLARQFITYKRDPATGDLEQTNAVDSLASGCDNVDVGADGMVYTGCHPQSLTFLKHSHNPKATLSPSQVGRYNPKTGQVEELLLSYGRDLSGSTCAYPIQGPGGGVRVVVGSVFDDGLLVCDV